MNGRFSRHRKLRSSKEGRSRIHVAKKNGVTPGRIKKKARIARTRSSKKAILAKAFWTLGRAMRSLEGQNKHDKASRKRVAEALAPFLKEILRESRKK